MLLRPSDPEQFLVEVSENINYFLPLLFEVAILVSHSSKVVSFAIGPNPSNLFQIDKLA